MKTALRANATSDLYTYVTLAREIDKRQMKFEPDISRILANRLAGAEMACSAVVGQRMIEQPMQRVELQELMEETKGLQTKLHPSPDQAR